MRGVQQRAGGFEKFVHGVFSPDFFTFWNYFTGIPAKSKGRFFMLTVLLRATILFLSAVFVVRLMGKRQVGQLQPYELVIAIMIAELAATPMEDVGVPLLYGIVPMLTLLILHSAFSVACVKNQRLREFLNGMPSVLIRRGVIQKAELLRSCYNLNDLLEELRACGVLNPAEVGTAVLETSGKMSVFPKSAYRPVTPMDLQMETGYEGIPLILVQDGDVDRRNLRRGGLDEAWLQKTLAAQGFPDARQVLLASLDTGGMLFVQGKGEKPRLKIFRALAPEKAVW